MIKKPISKGMKNDTKKVQSWDNATKQIPKPKSKKAKKY